MTSNEAIRNTGGRPPVGPKIEVRLPAAMIAELDDAASDDGISRAQLIRDAVDWYLHPGEEAS